MVFSAPIRLLHERFYNVSKFKLKRLLLFFWKPLNPIWMFFFSNTLVQPNFELFPFVKFIWSFNRVIHAAFQAMKIWTSQKQAKCFVILGNRLLGARTCFEEFEACSGLVTWALTINLSHALAVASAAPPYSKGRDSVCIIA